MNKKTAVALAVGAAFAAPALAQDSTLEIYGRLYPAFASFKASGATTATPPSNLVEADLLGNLEQRYSVDAYNTRVGFRGQERLGGGLSAIWQIEQRVQIDRGDRDFWANRDSFIGLRGGFGSIRFGRFDTIHNDYGNVTNFWGIKSGHFLSSTSLITDIGFGPGNEGFDTRRSNSIKYETPEFGGFQAGLSYGPDELKGNPGRDINRYLWAAAVKWSAGPVYLSAQYEEHIDHFDQSETGAAALSNIGTPGAESKDRSMRLSARYSITPNHRLSGDIGRLEYDEDAPGAVGTFDTFEKWIFQVGWEASWGGPWRTVVTYARADEGECTLTGGVACSTSGLKASQLAAGVAYDFSKRTFVYAGYSRLSLGESAFFDNWTNGDPSRGSDVTQWGLGIAHNF